LEGSLKFIILGNWGVITPYDSWLLEGQTTELGTKYVEIRKNKI
jgi:hypothetical protein